jgi:hypothetical protein
LLWTDRERGELHLFWGCPRLDGGFPFQWTTSSDSGVTWSEIRFPRFVGEIGPHSRQPINTALRDRHGTLYVASDGSGGSSVLWATRDDGATWFDTGGRSAGRHTTYALLGDGETILGMGGKNTDIEGFMPKAVSKDGGRTWQVSRTPFPALGTNQRPSLLRLASGRLFFAGDYQHFRGQKPEGVEGNGSYVALSEDDGETWRIRTIPGAQPHEDPRWHGGHPTLGYSAARQAPNGVIHLITTMNRPCLHFALNEAWILAGDAKEPPSPEAPAATRIAEVKRFVEKFADGSPRIEFSGGVADDGRFLLHGRETWYRPNGRKMREASYELGRKIGTETGWSEDGKKAWEWRSEPDGTRVWTRWWPNGKKKAESTWRDFRCDGSAILWDSKGRKVRHAEFAEGERVR